MEGFVGKSNLDEKDRVRKARDDNYSKISRKKKERKVLV